MKREVRLKLASLSRLSPKTLRKFHLTDRIIRKIRKREFSKIQKTTITKLNNFYSRIQYHRLRKSGLNRRESKRYSKKLPKEVKLIISKMNDYAEKIVKLNRVDKVNKISFEKALLLVKRSMGKKEWLFDDIDIYVNEERKGKPFKVWQEYRNYRKKHYVPYQTFLQIKAEQALKKERFPKL
jgi:hypothetical protein